MSTWDRSANNFGHSLTALDTTKKKSGSYSGRIDDNYPRLWSKYVYSDTWIPINNYEDTYYTVSGWVYVEDVTTNGYLPNLAKLWIVTRKQGERGYPTGHISTSSTKEGTWEYLSKTVLVPADVREINVRIENARLGKVWFDDVKIVKGNTSQTVIVEESNYYPFGLRHKGYNNVVSSNGNSTAQKFGFGGKELNEELGLEWHDFGARNYDASLGRWMNLDPLAEQMRRHSPYNYAFNNPVYWIDPDGMKPQDFTILIAKNGAQGHGHMAAVIEDGKGNYYYVTMGAAEQAGVSKMATIGVQGGMSVVKLNGVKNMSDAIAVAKTDTNNSPYTDHVTFKTTKKQDAKIFKKTKSKAKSINSGDENYNIITNNCTDAIEEPIENATNVSLPDNVEPNSNFDNVKKNKKNIQKKLDGNANVKKIPNINKKPNPEALKPWEPKI